MRILLIAGHGAGDPGAVGSGYKEADLTREVVSLLAPKLGQLCRVDIADTSKNWYEYLKSHSFNFKPYDYVLEVHFNSGGGTGTEIFVTTSEKGTGVETAIVQQICAAVGYKNRGVKRKDWNVISKAKAQGVSSALLEVCFIDSSADIKTYQSRKNDIINAIVDGIAEGFGLQQPKTDNKEDLTMTQYEELKKDIERIKADLVQKTGYYNYIDENMPASYRPTIQKLVDKKLLNGNEHGELMLTTDMMRILTILDRAGVFGT